jgi:hypothetical protein
LEAHDRKIAYVTHALFYSLLLCGFSCSWQLQQVAESNKSVPKNAIDGINFV